MITIYTDGSCHTQLRRGAYVALIFIEGVKTIIEDVEDNTTHNRMELMAVINAVRYLDKQNVSTDRIDVFTDSQFVAGLPTRYKELQKKNFLTNKGALIQNADLIQVFINQLETHPIHLVKVAAHQKQTGKTNYNREADKLVRSLMRRSIDEKTKT